MIIKTTLKVSSMVIILYENEAKVAFFVLLSFSDSPIKLKLC